MASAAAVVAAAVVAVAKVAMLGRSVVNAVIVQPPLRRRQFKHVWHIFMILASNDLDLVCLPIDRQANRHISLYLSQQLL